MTKAVAQSTSQRPTSGEATRRRLLAAAASLIVERGWSGVTTRAVAERADVNPGLVHYHFGSMDALLIEAAVARLTPEVRALIDELLDERPIPESLPRVMSLLDRFDLDSELGVLMAEAMLRATRDGRVSEAMGGVMGSWAELLEPRLRLAQSRAVVRADVDPAAMARVIAAMLDGFLIQRMVDPTLDATHISDALVQLLSPPGEETP